MVRAASAVFNRLRVTWFGSVLAIVWLAFLVAIPWVRDCMGIAAVQGGSSGIYCSWNPPLIEASGFGLLLLLLFVLVIGSLPLAFPNRRVLLSVGFGSAAIVLATIWASLDSSINFSLSEFGLQIGNVARSVFLFVLPASLAWIIAAFRQGRRA
jgi:hypothetical protein